MSTLWDGSWNNATSIYAAGWNTGQQQWDPARTPVLVTDVPAWTGQNKSLSASLNVGDTGPASTASTHRTEMVSSGAASTIGAGTYAFRFQVKLAAGFLTAPSFRDVCQWKNSGTGSPPLELAAGDHFSLQGGFNGGDNPDPADLRTLWSAPFTRLVWHEFVFLVKFATGGAGGTGYNGWVSMWHAEGRAVDLATDQLLNQYPHRTLYTGTTSYVKAGEYRASSATENDTVLHHGWVMGNTVADVMAAYGLRGAPGVPVQTGSAAGSLTFSMPAKPATMTASDFWQVYVNDQAVELSLPNGTTSYTLTTAKWPTLVDGTPVNIRVSYGAPGAYSDWSAAAAMTSGVAVVGTATTYVLTTADVGHTITLGVVASNAAGSSPEATSAPTATVAAAAATPTNAGAPAISGTAQSGSALTGTMGTWNANGSAITGYAYQWQRETAAASGIYTNIAGAAGTGSGGSVTYTAAAGDVGLRIRLSVTATNAAGTSTAAVSAPTAAVTSAAASLVLARYALAFAGGTDRIILANAGSVGVEPIASGALVYFTPGAARRYQALALPADTSTPARALVVDTSTDRAGWDDQANGPRGQTGFPTGTWAWLCATRDVGGLIRAIFCNLSTGVWSALYQATSAGSITAAASAGNIVLGNAAQTTSGTISWIGRILAGFKANAYYTQAQMQAPVVSSGGVFYVDPAALLAAPSVEHVWRADNPSQPIQDSKGTAHELATGGRVGTSVYDAGSAILPLKVS